MALRFGRFVGAWLFLSAMLNVRFPGDETKLSYLWPSLDVTLVLLALAVVAARAWRLPRWVLPTLAVLVFLIRLVRLGDGIQRNYFHRPFNAYLDLPLVPEMVRLFWSTSRPLGFVLASLAGLACVAGLVLAVRWALAECAAFVAEARGRKWFAATLLGLVLATPLGPKAHGDEQFDGTFASSAVPRLFEEADFLLHVSGYREARLREVHEVTRRLQSAPSSLSRLGSLPVLLFLVESYGVTVFDPALPSPPTQKSLDDFESALRARGYSVASGLLDSPVYGGSSWLAQATLATAVQTSNEFQLALVKAEQPPTIADFFRRAGYRTVLVQPGTTRPWPERDYLRFEARYASFDLDYKGPRFSWAPMPDQFVIEQIHRREVALATRPLFVTYALVSSHAPWSEHPEFVSDWSRIGDGGVYNHLPKARFDTRLTAAGNKREAYLSSIRYDFEVLGSYLCERLASEALVFVLGDHQPIPDATGHSQRRSVPLHVLSRRRELLDAWLARGYVPSMRPNLERGAEPLASFLPTLLEALSARADGVQG